MTEIDKSISKPDTDSPDLNEKKDEAQASKTTQLLELMSNEEFFHDEQKNAYVTLFNTGHHETWALDSDKFEKWLSFKYWVTYGKAIHGAALNDAIATLKGQAIFNGKCQQVFTRVGHTDGKIYLNLANTKWQSVEISETGWKLIEKSPIKFQSSKNMQPLPTPIAGAGNICKLWEHTNIPEASRILVIAWLIDSLIPWTPFPLLALTGLQGSGKSTTQERLRRMIDPSHPNLRNPPKNSDDIATAALNNWVVSYNNVSRLSNQNQDDFCCLSTGGGFARRKLYTTGEEFVADTKRPIVINGIGDIITRQDLLDRTVSIIIPSLDQYNRKQDSDLDNAFESDYPMIFTGLLDLLVQALKIIPTINLIKKPRMASFAVLGKALERKRSLMYISEHLNNNGNFKEIYVARYRSCDLPSLQDR